MGATRITGGGSAGHGPAPSRSSPAAQDTARWVPPPSAEACGTPWRCPGLPHPPNHLPGGDVAHSWMGTCDMTSHRNMKGRDTGPRLPHSQGPTPQPREPPPQYTPQGKGGPPRQLQFTYTACCFPSPLPIPTARPRSFFACRHCTRGIPLNASYRQAFNTLWGDVYSPFAVAPDSTFPKKFPTPVRHRCRRRSPACQRWHSLVGWQRVS